MWDNKWVKDKNVSKNKQRVEKNNRTKTDIAGQWEDGRLNDAVIGGSEVESKETFDVDVRTTVQFIILNE